MKCKNNRILYLIGIYTIILAVGMLYLIFAKLTGFGFGCTFYNVTGYYCAGCGITRMLQALLELKVYQAFRYNPGVFVISPLLIYYFIMYNICYIKKKEYRMSKNTSFLWIVVAILFLLYGILRNIPQFSYLAPTKIG